MTKYDQTNVITLTFPTMRAAVAAMASYLKGSPCVYLDTPGTTLFVTVRS